MLDFFEIDVKFFLENLTFFKQMLLFSRGSVIFLHFFVDLGPFYTVFGQNKAFLGRFSWYFPFFQLI